MLVAERKGRAAGLGTRCRSGDLQRPHSALDKNVRIKTLVVKMIYYYYYYHYIQGIRGILTILTIIMIMSIMIIMTIMRIIISPSNPLIPS